ncbi:hypothetical protein GCM10029992_66760 [Glycomyces albus]
MAPTPVPDDYEQRLANALAEELTQAGYDGTDPERIAWVRLDHAGRLVALAFSPTVDRLSDSVVVTAVGEAWTAAETERAGAARRVGRAAAEAGLAPSADPRPSELRRLAASRAAERFEHTSEDGLCSAEVDVDGSLTAFEFLVPNATVDNGCESLAERAAAVIRAAQRKAAEAFAAPADSDSVPGPDLSEAE